MISKPCQDRFLHPILVRSTNKKKESCWTQMRQTKKRISSRYSNVQLYSCIATICLQYRSNFYVDFKQKSVNCSFLQSNIVWKQVICHIQATIRHMAHRTSTITMFWSSMLIDIIDNLHSYQSAIYLLHNCLWSRRETIQLIFYIINWFNSWHFGKKLFSNVVKLSFAIQLKINLITWVIPCCLMCLTLRFW